MCYTPITLFRKENIGVGEKYAADRVPCGKCPDCLRKRQAAWIFRLQQEQQVSLSAAFLTLTYQDSNLKKTEKGLNTLVKRHHQLFIKRLRKSVSRITAGGRHTLGIKYYSCGEYGEKTERPHYHSIMFNLPEEYFKHPELLTRDWQLGNTMLAVANPKTIAYTTKYINKTAYTQPWDKEDDRLKEFSVMSKGLGAHYLTPNRIKYYQRIKVPYLIVANGEKAVMPRYYKDKIYDVNDKYLIRKKTEKFLEENPKYHSPKNQIDYISNQFLQQQRRNAINRQTI